MTVVEITGTRVTVAMPGMWEYLISIHPPSLLFPLNLSASMAIHRLLFLSILLGFVAISATARPCKTIFFISSTTSSSFPVDQNPNLPLQNPKFLTLSFTEVRQLNPKPSYISYDDNLIFPGRRPLNPSRFPAEFDGSVGNSVRDRTLDIMAVIGALLFGVGSGALFVGTMYLIWYCISPRSFSFGGDSDDVTAYDDDIGPKKMGYVAISADTVVATPAKQVE